MQSSLNPNDFMFAVFLLLAGVIMSYDTNTKCVCFLFSRNMRKRCFERRPKTLDGAIPKVFSRSPVQSPSQK